MGFKKLVHFVYGLLMGTSVSFLRPPRRLRPVKIIDLKTAKVFIGGFGNAVAVSTKKGQILIDGSQKEILKNQLSNISGIHTLILTHDHQELLSGLEVLDRGVKVLFSSSINAKTKRSIKEMGFKIEEIEPNQNLIIDGTSLEFFCFKNAHTYCDLCVYLKSEKLLHAGGVVHWRYHPVIDPKLRDKQESWIEALEFLLKIDIEKLIPGEGEICSINDISECIQYLKDLSDQNVDYETFGKKYGTYQQIIGHSSLSDNFDLVRGLI